MTHVGSQCADHAAEHSTAVARMEQMKSETLTTSQSKMVESFMKTLSTYTSALDKDRELNEVILLDEATAPHKHYASVAVSSEVSEVFGFLDCSSEASPGCADPDLKSLTTDIFLNLQLLDQDSSSLDIPDDDILNARPNLVFPDACNPKTDAYETLVHEAGHAVGIGGGEGENQGRRNHPTIFYSIMNYSGMPFVEIQDEIIRPNETDCSLYPFDIMAIYSLYQNSK